MPVVPTSEACCSTRRGTRLARSHEQVTSSSDRVPVQPNHSVEPIDHFPGAPAVADRRTGPPPTMRAQSAPTTLASPRTPARLRTKDSHRDPIPAKERAVNEREPQDRAHRTGEEDAQALGTP